MVKKGITAGEESWIYPGVQERENCRIVGGWVLYRDGEGVIGGGLEATKSIQKASNRWLSRSVRKFRTELTPPTDLNIPDYLSHLPTAVRHPASTTPLPIN